MKEDQMISEDRTIFALFEVVIASSLEKQQNRDKSVKFEDFIDEQRHVFIEMKEDLVKKYTDQARFFAEKMGPELAATAQLSVKNIIEKIYQKSMTKWQDKQAAATVEYSLIAMENKLKEFVFAAKLSNRNITADEFSG